MPGGGEDTHVRAGSPRPITSAVRTPMPEMVRHPDVDAISCASDQIARGAGDRLRELGNSIPGDVAVTGFDDWEVMSLACRPPLTTVDMELKRFGRRAATMLLEAIAGTPHPGTQVIRTRLINAGIDSEKLRSNAHLPVEVRSQQQRHASHQSWPSASCSRNGRPSYIETVAGRISPLGDGSLRRSGSDKKTRNRPYPDGAFSLIRGTPGRHDD